MNKQEFFEDQLEVAYHAEELIFDLLGNIKPNTEAFKKVLQDHLDETDDDLDTLNSIFEALGREPVGKPSSIEALAYEAENAYDNHAVMEDIRTIQNLVRMQAFVQNTYALTRAVAENLSLGREILDPLDEVIEDDQAFTNALISCAAELLVGME